MTDAPLPAYKLDESRWPLVVITPTSAVKDALALDVAYAAFDTFAAKQRPFVMLLDIRGAASDPARRKRLTAWTKTNRKWLNDCLVATAVVVGSAIERGFVTAALWLLSPNSEIRVFTDRTEAVEWLLKTYEIHQQAKRSRG
jgi:hypothetical protein